MVLPRHRALHSSGVLILRNALALVTVAPQRLPRGGAVALTRRRRCRPAVVVLCVVRRETILHCGVWAAGPVWSAARDLFSSAGPRPKNFSLPGPQGAQDFSLPGQQGAKDRAYRWQKTGPTGG